MSAAGPDRQQLTEEAIDLVIRLQNDDENPVAHEMIRAWRERSPLHEEIWTRVARIHGASGKILTAQRRAERRQGLGLTRRNLMIGGLVVAGTAAAGYVIGPDILVQARADFITDKGENRDVVLPDGTFATLGPDSAIALDFTPQRRALRLLAGMAFFDVARDPQRPFAVTAAELTSTALGTAFDIANDAGFLSVSVDRGVVEARALDGGEELKLAAGEWMTFDPSSRNIDRGTREAGQIASWRDNLVIAERDAVSALVARIGRWIPGRIVMADPFIGAERVSGIFDLTNPMRALEAVVHPTGARVRRVSSFLTVISPL